MCIRRAAKRVAAVGVVAFPIDHDSLFMLRPGFRTSRTAMRLGARLCGLMKTY